MSLRPIVVALTLGVALLSGCGSGEDTTGAADASTVDTSADSTEGSTKPAVSGVVDDHDEDIDHEWDDSDVSSIWLTEKTASAEGDGASIDGSVVTITSAGTY
ncbi:MAG: hypothetical protein GY926_20245 [bacterium]|nr:hypothetical protein [bacterium]